MRQGKTLQWFPVTGNGHKLKYRKCCLNMRKKFLYCEGIEHWCGLSREAVVSVPGDIQTPPGYDSETPTLSWPWFEQRVAADDFQMPFLTAVVCDSVRSYNNLLHLQKSPSHSFYKIETSATIQ